MKVRMKNQLLVVSAESDEEKAAVAEWAARMDGHVFVLRHQDEQTFRLTALGPRLEACREPINITSRSTDPPVRLISNLAHTPFELDGNAYASVEAFWQGLKFPDPARRREIAALHGQDARQAGLGRPKRTRPSIAAMSSGSARPTTGGSWCSPAGPSSPSTRRRGKPCWGRVTGRSNTRRGGTAGTSPVSSWPTSG